MIKKMMLPILCLSIILAACSSENSQDKADRNENNAVAYDMASEQKEEMSVDRAQSGAEGEQIRSDRMIIHQANMEVKVKDLEKNQRDIEAIVKNYGGYVVEANVYRQEDEKMRGFLTVRIPEKKFQTFLDDVEEGAAEVVSRNISGQDVTEEYVDLESRLKSKRAVEERLLDFMKGADKTEDLLKISGDLAKVQEEIEVLVGRMKYLENQTAYSTVTIHMYENKVVVPGVDGSKLDTWEKTKQQLAVSLNFLLAAASGLVVFFVGNLPVLFVLLMLGSGIYFALKKKRKDS